MKKIVLTVMVLFSMALTACGKSEESTTTETTGEVTTESGSQEQDLTENITEETTEEVTEEVTEETTEGTTEEVTEETIGNIEAQKTDNAYINELLNINGSYTDSVGNTGNYIYQIPQFNADSDSAKALNQRIESDLNYRINPELESMEGGFSLTCHSVTYEAVQYGEIVAIIVTVPYDNDYKVYFAYTYDFENDKELTNSDLLAMKNMTEEDFVEKACKMGEEYFMEQANIMGITSQEDMDIYQQGAREATSAELPMYLDENGVLNAYVPFPSVAGASFYYHLCQF